MLQDGSYDSENLSDRNKRQFLLSVTIQEVMVNEQIENIVFFKDVTFGILYEVTKANKRL